MASRSHSPHEVWNRRERPWLIPSSRKLRHLHAITLRNLSLDQEAIRPRRQTIDDEALPTTKKSPAKMLALRESKHLGHSRSQDNLRPIHENALHSSLSSSESALDLSSSSDTPLSRVTSPVQVKIRSPSRPTFAKMRRRSTLEWASAGPSQRQKTLEDVSAARMADIFFSLHVSGIEDPIYVSEVVKRAMNPNFNHVDLDDASPAIRRLDSLTVRFWSKTERQQRYSLLIDMTLSLRSLQFLGKSLATFHHPFPPNCVLFQLADGFYTAFTDARVDEPEDPFASLPVKQSSRNPLPTSSFDALLRLSKLDDSVQDALELRHRLATSLEHVVHDHQLVLTEDNRLSETEDYVKTIEYGKGTVQKQLKTLRQRLYEKRKNVESRRDLLVRERQNQANVSKNIRAEKEEMVDMREQTRILTKGVAAQRRRISTDVQKIYPIAPLPSRGPLAFEIRGLYLPDSEHLDARHAPNPETIAAALGHISHVLQLLSFYWRTILPYHPHPRSSSSTITDLISNLSSTNPAGASSTSSPFPIASAGQSEKAIRTFPLFPKGAVRFRFEYGLFLLNKDIQLLLEMAWGVRVLDIRQTLPNLLHALYCATAGEGELVARKAGGVRGLAWMGRDGRADLERRDSEDSTAVGSEDGHSKDGNGVAVGDMAAFESLKKVGRRRERRLDAG